MRIVFQIILYILIMLAKLHILLLMPIEALAKRVFFFEYMCEDVIEYIEDFKYDMDKEKFIEFMMYILFTIAIVAIKLLVLLLMPMTALSKQLVYLNYDFNNMFAVLVYVRYCMNKKNILEKYCDDEVTKAIEIKKIVEQCNNSIEIVMYENLKEKITKKI